MDAEKRSRRHFHKKYNEWQNGAESAGLDCVCWDRMKKKREEEGELSGSRSRSRPRDKSVEERVTLGRVEMLPYCGSTMLST